MLCVDRWVCWVSVGFDDGCDDGCVVLVDRCGRPLVGVCCVCVCWSTVGCDGVVVDHEPHALSDGPSNVWASPSSDECKMAAAT